MRWRGIAPRALALASLALPAAAQDTAPQLPLELGQPAQSPVTRLEVPSPIVTVDTDRLFAESAWGRRVQAEVERRGQALIAENRRIEEALVAEEQALTRLRPELEPDEFRRRASEFDDKVQKLRADQDAKGAELAAFRDGERQRFFAALPGVLARVVQERGAVAIIDERVVILSVAAIDITEDAIARVDAELGDGSTP